MDAGLEPLQLQAARFAEAQHQTRLQMLQAADARVSQVLEAALALTTAPLAVAEEPTELRLKGYERATQLVSELLTAAMANLTAQQESMEESAPTALMETLEQLAELGGELVQRVAVIEEGMGDE